MLKVLIVDDDPAVAGTFARMLDLEGYEVLTALDAETALRTIDAFHPDAVLLDLRMPLMDGIAFLRRLRARRGQRHTPVAILTADYFLDEETMHELKRLDSEVHFKPVWLDDLIAITRQLVHKDA